MSQWKSRKVTDKTGIEIVYFEKCTNHDNCEFVTAFHDYEHDEITEQVKEQMLLDARQSKSWREHMI